MDEHQPFPFELDEVGDAPLKYFNSPQGRLLLGRDDSERTEHLTLESCNGDWTSFISRRLDILTVDIDKTSRDELFNLGYSAYTAFLQCNVTGPPLRWNVAEQLQPPVYNDPMKLSASRREIIRNLAVDGEAVYHLMPGVELFALAQIILNHARIAEKDTWMNSARVHVNFLHQRLLNDKSATLQKRIYEDLESIAIDQETPLIKKSFFILRAAINIHHGYGEKAREDLDQAAKVTGFQYVLTGRLGKRTKYQERDLSQLVVLAKSEAVSETEGKKLDGDNQVSFEPAESINQRASQPDNLDLNDDTLLESITFADQRSHTPEQPDQYSTPPSLAPLDPSNQPPLSPLDSIILLAHASSITNTSPLDGLTREETLPYATRVLQDGSNNWQIYSHALLVRSRIEGYKSRTVERGVLQLQALVDQVITETTLNNASLNQPSRDAQTSFLPKPKPSESAPVFERLKYINELAPPTRWELEAELANRWVSLGGLRTALEIYERLQMWAEVALCWAASDREDKAKNIIRHQLFSSSLEPNGSTTNGLPISGETETDASRQLIEKDPLPADAPRLFCILGDLEKSPSAYERAWKISKHRYARAQRSLGKYYFARKDLQKADEAYTKALSIVPLDHSTWFAVGGVRLQLEDWPGAIDAFRRAVQIEEKDAESWSNMAAALVRLPVKTDVSFSPSASSDREKTEEASLDDEDTVDAEPLNQTDPQQHIREAFAALRRAASLKRDSHRIWQNLLSVSVKLSPPPYTDIIVAQSRLVDLLGSREGESCVDVEILEGLLAHLVSTSLSSSSSSSCTGTSTSNSSLGFENQLITLIEQK
ncbi:MAG: hypothetical protein Q9190_007526, partial [Brigantiaea leucoxantha]